MDISLQCWFILSKQISDSFFHCSGLRLHLHWKPWVPCGTILPSGRQRTHDHQKSNLGWWPQPRIYHCRKSRKNFSWFFGIPDNAPLWHFPSGHFKYENWSFLKAMLLLVPTSELQWISLSLPFSVDTTSTTHDVSPMTMPQWINIKRFYNASLCLTKSYFLFRTP